jgi:large-conductance mechanosensitive channel
MDISSEVSDFFKENEIITTIIATILAANISTLTKSLMDNILMPLINIDINNDGEADRDTLKKFYIKFRGVDIKIGEFILTLIEFSIILFIIYYLHKLSKKLQLK